jgi:hypothetical protein
MFSASLLMVITVEISTSGIEKQIDILERIRWQVGMTGALLGLAIFFRDAKKQRKNTKTEQMNACYSQPASGSRKHGS